ncbi:MAG: excinuclease ABC subunit UvrC [Bacteroidota bacterium]|nr:excinuclease ABC subunit UvrC [Candidatus Kapabacteria bacterium]MCX7936847.1 excinuclease ABC subunit UvrC [Chlorobiota bacterium]MDW8074566.1 excinuclease ABC subunit UvrC [Bacteroidota bacterium]
MVAQPQQEKLLEKVDRLPSQPGVYLFKDGRGTILYVGKAKNLRQRVRQYFDSSRPHDAKTVAMLRRAADLDWIVTDTDVEALLLENNLIKEHKPRYNILLKDDKTYPYIRVTNEAYPRIFPTRRVVRDGSLYFGPYTDVQYMHFLLKTLRTLFPIRSCSLPLSEESIAKGKFKVCLDYHIGKCEGPCVGYITQDQYRHHVQQAIQFLRGKTKSVEEHLETQMQQLAEELKFEQAAILRDRLHKLRSYLARQKVVSTELIDRDVVGFAVQDGYACVIILITREGKVIGKQQWIVATHDASPAEIVRSVIERWYLETDDIPGEILLPLDLDEQKDFLLEWFAQSHSTRVELVIPKIGDKRKLVTLACANAEYQLRDYLLHRSKREQAIPRNVAALQRDLRLDKPPLRIECFDNSHLQGSDYVSSMVVFINGKPHKSEYRRYRLRNVEGNDDYRAIAEVVRRRYQRVLRENLPLPDLIIVDGGKGQLSAAVAVLRELGIAVPIIALAKRLEEIYRPGEQESVLLPRTSSSLRLLQHIRDEAHRFAIEYHKLLRTKRTLTTELLEIPGIGEKTAQKLLRMFGSVAAIKEATLEQLKEAVQSRQAEAIYKHFHATNGNEQELTIEEL